MISMFQTGSGIFVPFPEQIREEYEPVNNSVITANVSLEHLPDLIAAFCQQLEPPLFFALHIPLNENREIELFGKSPSTNHQEVFYLDGQTLSQIQQLFTQYGELLFNDGLCEFAVGSHTTGEEIFIRKYHVVHFFSKNQSKCISLLEKFDFVCAEKIKTPWDTFSHDSPGICSSVRIHGIDIYMMVEELKKLGLYSYEITEEA